MGKEIEKRKESHIRICLGKDVESLTPPGFDDITLVHQAIPELDLDEIDIRCRFLGKDMKAPFVIEAITGGAKIAEKININIARACEENGVAFGTGSVRAALCDDSLWRTYQVRDVAPTIPIISNIGLVQIISEFGPHDVDLAVRKTGADAIAVHLNALQEAIQPEGDVNFRDGMKKLQELCKSIDVPVIVKETGAGIASETAKMIEGAGAKMIDVAGVGGTSFAKVEYHRDKNDEGAIFSDWGITTACSVAECRGASELPIIASGGVRTGLDAAKAIAIGADYAGFARPVLEAALRSHKDVSRIIQVMTKELKIAMFLAGAKNIDELKKRQPVITGKTREWLEQRRTRQ